MRKILMSNNIKTFRDLCFIGKVNTNSIDKFIKKWHKSKDNRSLAEYLGFTEEEYVCWLEKPEILQEIIDKKEK
jgi:hypothetical protein